ncbi:MAG: GNAT family N-acetyltransferase [Jatrophihabitans sp.]|uniref:GNAT family N-acetyltransferase n=1 Tax=Jatrophihabitans sp. TaxID=1932789 RepID=UPI003F7DD5EF
MTPRDEPTARILDVAAELFAERGYGGTTVGLVAERAGVSARTVRRLTGRRDDLFARVVTDRLTSEAADRIAQATTGPDDAPPLDVLLDVIGHVASAPQSSWPLLELEALLRAHRDEHVRALERGRIGERAAGVGALLARVREAGGLDDTVDLDALVELALALSVGLAVLDPVTDRPTRPAWNALMARLGAAVAPPDALWEADDVPRRPWRLRVDLPDRPGGLARLARTLGALQASVVGSALLAVDDGVRTVDLAVTAPRPVTGETLLAAAMAVGSNAHVVPGAWNDRVDLPTRVLDAATELVTDPGAAPLAAAALVGADRVEVTDAVEGDDDAADVLRLQWTADRHVVLHREWAPFVRAERARASALLRLSAAIAAATGDGDRTGWVEPIAGGSTVWIRLGRPADADAVAAMHDRCSQRTLYRRYLAGGGEWRDVTLRRLSGGHRGATLVVMSEEGAIVGLGNVFPDEPGDGGTAEIAELVEDAYQQRGVGTRLLRHMIALAQQLGFRALVAHVLAENAKMLRVLDRTRLTWTHTIDQGVVTLRAALPETARTAHAG